MLRACMKIVNTPKQRAFFRHTALNFLAIRQILHGRIERPCRIIVHDPSMGSLHDMDACENLPCLAKKIPCCWAY